MDRPPNRSVRTNMRGFPAMTRRIDDVRPAAVHHIPVAESVEVKTKNSPLSAYMVNSKYINPDAPMLPKRPLGPMGQLNRTSPVSRPNPLRQPQPVFYDRLSGQEITDRIRRPMRLTRGLTSAAAMSPMAAATAGAAYTAHRHDERHAPLARLGVVFAPVAAAFLLAKDKLFGAADHATKSHAAKPSGILHALDPRVHYTALHGAVARKFGMRTSWFKVAVPLFVLAGLLGAAMFNNVLSPSNEPSNPTNPGITDNSGSSDGSSSNGGNPNAPTSPTPGAGSMPGQNGSAAGPAQDVTGGQLQPSRVDPVTGLPVGGRGGGDGTSSSDQISIGEGTTGTGSDPTGSVTGGVIPYTTTVPGKDVLVDDKRVVETSDTTVTAN